MQIVKTGLDPILTGKCLKPSNDTFIECSCDNFLAFDGIFEIMSNFVK